MGKKLSTNTENNQPPRFWRGFKEFNNDEEFIKAKANEFIDESLPENEIMPANLVSRRKFLALLSASAAFVATGCSDYRDKGKLVPYNKQPEEITLGIANYYASTCTACSNYCGILIKTREGRPIKVDGNPDHPINQGKICVKGQAHIFNLYDPERLKEPAFITGTSGYMTNVSWNDVDTKIVQELKKIVSQGKEIAIITHSIYSPTQEKLLQEFLDVYKTAKVYSYELFDQSTVLSAYRKSFGMSDLPVVRLENAKIVVSLESDFLGTEGNILDNIRRYIQGRNIIEPAKFNKLYVVEGNVSLTGANADVRIRLRPDAIEEFVLALLNELLINRNIAPKYKNNQGILEKVNKYALSRTIEKFKLDKDKINNLVDDLVTYRGESFVLGGYKLTESAHIAINLLNEILENTRLFSDEMISLPYFPLATSAEIERVVTTMNSGMVGAVIHFDTNPVFHWSPELNYPEALQKVPLVLTLTESLTETAVLSHYVLPISHTFESWGDYMVRKGIYSLQQPVINPIYNTRQKETILLNWIRENKNFTEDIYYLYIKNNWEKLIYPQQQTGIDFNKFWTLSLHDGVFVTRVSKQPTPQYNQGAFTSTKFNEISNDGFVLTLPSSYFVGDGRFANNGWLQEIPHPITKIVWDNYAAISPDTAKKLGLNSNDRVEISVEGRKLVVPVLLQPGMSDDTISIELGYGRTKSGMIASDVGFNACLLLSKNPRLSKWIYDKVNITKTDGTYNLVSTQEHYPIDDQRFKDIQLKREIIFEGTVDKYLEDPEFLKKEKKQTQLFSITREVKYEGYKWGMTIDLNKCIGCATCVAACNVENNIPVVGKDQVERNREMHWIRIDRYFSGSPEEPQISFQPMLCQHCDNAPCENVCPVSATNHSPDGLNQMAYNRCVGTRYCSNNCPYKVRRFNYYNFRNYFANGLFEKQPINLLYNPEVTVRSRGVMEKCTFCIQRIMEERQHAIEQNRPVNGENVKTACQEACPSNAIVFGDINNQQSEVAKLRNHNLGYFVLEEINIKPNVTYLTKLRNIKAEN
ncbi:MAG: TAT-variant-translocated molybdopterin oxidoreductase [Ignavibacteria bacterium]